MSKLNDPSSDKIIDCSTGGQTMRVGVFLAIFDNITINLINVGKKEGGYASTTASRTGLGVSHFSYLKFIIKMTGCLIMCKLSTGTEINIMEIHDRDKTTRERILHLIVIPNPIKDGLSLIYDSENYRVDIGGGNIGLVIQFLDPFLRVSKNPVHVTIIGIGYAPSGPPLDEIQGFVNFVNDHTTSKLDMNILPENRYTFRKTRTQQNQSTVILSVSGIGDSGFTYTPFKFEPLGSSQFSINKVVHKVPQNVIAHDYNTKSDFVPTLTTISLLDTCWRTIIKDEEMDIKTKELIHYATLFGVDPRMTDQIIIHIILAAYTGITFEPNLPVFTFDNLNLETPQSEKDDILSHQKGMVRVIKTTTVEHLFQPYIEKYFRSGLVI
jgi:hypothetical protein